MAKRNVNPLAGLPILAAGIIKDVDVVAINKSYKTVVETAGELTLDEAFFGAVAVNPTKPILGYFPGGTTINLNGAAHAAYSFVSIEDIQAGLLKLVLDAGNQQVSHYASTEVVVGAFPGPDPTKFSAPVTLGYNKGVAANNVTNEVNSALTVAVPVGSRLVVKRADIGLVTDPAAAAPITNVSVVTGIPGINFYTDGVLLPPNAIRPIAEFQGDLEIENVSLSAAAPSKVAINFGGAYAMVLDLTVYSTEYPEGYVPPEVIDPPPTGGGGEGEIDEGDVVNPEAVPGYWNVISDGADGLKSRNIHTGKVYEGTHDGFNTMLQEAGATPTIKARR